MVERLRALAERPLDPRAARAATVLAAAIFAGLAVLILLAGSEQGRRSRAQRTPVSRPVLVAPPPSTLPSAKPRVARTHRRRHPAQDPQDRRGSADARRAARELTSHRALQHVPYSDGEVRIALIGAAGSWAILRVNAPTIAAAKRGWRAFLYRYRDSGRAYLPRFHLDGGNGG